VELEDEVSDGVLALLDEVLVELPASARLIDPGEQTATGRGSCIPSRCYPHECLCGARHLRVPPFGQQALPCGDRRVAVDSTLLWWRTVFIVSDD
jgi:hypothetical protein